MEIQESGEMYLETILRLKKTKSIVRAVDIVEELSYAKSSVSKGLNNLVKKGFIVVGNDGFVEFTPSGKAIAENIINRHTVLTEFFMKMGVAKEIAEKDACRVEHVISEETFEMLKKHCNR